MKTILIVDDNPQNLYLLDVLLKTHGYRVEKASNGLEALKVARKTQMDMVISDILMPTMDGFGLCRAWKADELLKGIPFIFYTATYTDPRDEKFALSLGAERFLVKPMDTEDFLAIVREIFESEATNKPIEHEEADLSEKDFYEAYNQTLIRKLEDKMGQLQKSNKRLASLYRVSCDLHVVKPLTGLIDWILQSVIEITGYQSANYFTYDEKQKKLVLLASIGFSDEVTKKLQDDLNLHLSGEKSLAGMVAKSGQMINIGDTSKEPNWIDLDPMIKSALFTTVHFEDTLQGVIGLFSHNLNAFSDEEEHDIAILANSLAIAIENNKNEEQEKKQLARIFALYNIDMAINSSMDLKTILNVFLKHFTTLLKVDAADVLLSGPDSFGFEFSAGRGFMGADIENNRLRKGNSLDKKAALERRLIQVNELSDQEVSPEFEAMWAKEKFVAYFAMPLISKGEVVGVLEVFQRNLFDTDPEWSDFFVTLAEQAAIAIDNARMFNKLLHSNIELNAAYDATIKGWSRAMDLRDKETEGHTQRVTEMTVRLAEKLKFSHDKIVQIRRGAQLHDLGKLGVPDAILLKPGPLTDEEWKIMRQHPQIAYDMLQPIDYLQPALDIPFCHHEKWDGSGYPRGLKGEEIPLEARMFAIVDVWDALRSGRPYRKAWPEVQVLAYLREQSGKQFDPALVEPFIAVLQESSEFKP